MQKVWVIVRQSPGDNYAQHVAPATWLGELVGCACGHGIGRHTSEGCEGDYRGCCPCRDKASDVLGLAVHLAREA
jgi:hypothetical protein